MWILSFKILLISLRLPKTASVKSQLPLAPNYTCTANITNSPYFTRSSVSSHPRFQCVSYRWLVTTVCWWVWTVSNRSSAKYIVIHIYTADKWWIWNLRLSSCAILETLKQLYVNDIVLWLSMFIYFNNTLFVSTFMRSVLSSFTISEQALFNVTTQHKNP